MNKNEAHATEAFRIDVDIAEKLIRESMPSYAEERVSLAASAGRVLRQNVVAERDQPPFDRATMDGIAIAGDSLTAANRSYKIAGTQAAGQAVPAEQKPSLGCNIKWKAGNAPAYFG